MWPRGRNCAARNKLSTLFFLCFVIFIDPQVYVKRVVFLKGGESDFLFTLTRVDYLRSKLNGREE